MFILRCRDVKICILSASGNLTLHSNILNWVCYFIFFFNERERGERDRHIYIEREREIKRLRDVCVYIFIHISVPQ